VFKLLVGTVVNKISNRCINNWLRKICCIQWPWRKLCA